jgi:hypothetical protein
VQFLLFPPFCIYDVIITRLPVLANEGGSGPVTLEFRQVNATGTAYTVTNSLAFVDLGTVDPTLVITSPGTWRITGRIRVNRVAATFSGAHFATVALRRTNNTPATLDIGGYGLINLNGTALETSSSWIPVDVFYTTLNSDDSISWFASVNALPSAGSVTIDEAGITAQKVS